MTCGTQMGLVHQEAGESEAGLEWLQRATAIDPRNARAWKNMAVMHFRLPDMMLFDYSSCAATYSRTRPFQRWTVFYLSVSIRCTTSVFE